jgi:hypothetical protein
MSEIMRNMARPRMKMKQAPTPIFTATFNRGPGGVLVCVWLLAVALPMSDVVVEAGSVGEDEGEEDVGVESDARDCDVDVDALPWDELVGAEDGLDELEV